LTRLVLDTNVVVAGLLWFGPPRRLIDHAIERRFELCSSTVLIDELTRTLGYSKFARRRARDETNVTMLVAQYQSALAKFRRRSCGYALLPICGPGYVLAPP